MAATRWAAPGRSLNFNETASTKPGAVQSSAGDEHSARLEINQAATIKKLLTPATRSLMTYLQAQLRNRGRA